MRIAVVVVAQAQGLRLADEWMREEQAGMSVGLEGAQLWSARKRELVVLSDYRIANA